MNGPQPRKTKIMTKLEKQLLATQVFVLEISSNTGKLQVNYQSSAQGAKVSRVISSLEDMRQFFTSKAKEFGLPDADHLNIMCSSSLDFPDEYTTDPAVVEMANTIRGVTTTD